MKLRIAATLMALGLAACATSEVGTTFDYSAAARFKEGQSTKTEIEAALGPATTVTTSANGNSALVYQHVVGKANGFTGKAGAVGQTATFIFDKNGTLIQKTLSTIGNRSKAN
jgi:outer membrane protein assembly factor BamE (lipoprotein component of BamABCDE complex)